MELYRAEPYGPLNAGPCYQRLWWLTKLDYRILARHWRMPPYSSSREDTPGPTHGKELCRETSSWVSAADTVAITPSVPPPSVATLSAYSPTLRTGATHCGSPLPPSSRSYSTREKPPSLCCRRKTLRRNCSTPTARRRSEHGCRWGLPSRR